MHAPNRQAREVHSGHYARPPTPLPSPRLVVVSDDVCIKLLRLDAATCQSEALRAYSAAATFRELIPGFGVSQATPYAAFNLRPRGPTKRRGTEWQWIWRRTRDFDCSSLLFAHREARAPIERRRTDAILPQRRWTCVLRSSTREFLASEAMAALGVPTTRALSLVASKSETVQRPWYRNASTDIAIGMHKPVKHGGDLMRSEATAITTRVATSFSTCWAD